MGYRSGMRKLLEIASPDINSSTQLNEDIGNLENISSPLQVALKSGWSSSSPRIGPSHLGPQSKIIIGEYKNASQAYRELVDGSAAGILITDGEDQLAIIVGQPTPSYRSTKFGKYGSSYAVDETVMAEKYPDSELMQKITNYDIRPKDHNTAENQVKTLIRLLQKAIRDTGGKVGMQLLTVDTERLEKRKERKANQPIDMTSQEYIRGMRQQLKIRLDQFKSSRAAQVGSVEEMLPYIIEKGYIDKINVGGFTYSLSNDRINLRSLSGKDSFHGESTIEYTIDQGPDWREMYRANDEENRPPERLEVVLGLEGGRIVPKSVRAKARW